MTYFDRLSFTTLYTVLCLNFRKSFSRPKPISSRKKLCRNILLSLWYPVADTMNLQAMVRSHQLTNVFVSLSFLYIAFPFIIFADFNNRN